MDRKSLVCESDISDEELFTPSGGHMEGVYEFHIPSVDSKCGIIRGSSYYNTNARLIGGE